MNETVNQGRLMAAIIEELQRAGKTLCSVTLSSPDPNYYWYIVIAQHDYMYEYETSLSCEDGVFKLANMRIRQGDELIDDLAWAALSVKQPRAVARRVVQAFKQLTKQLVHDGHPAFTDYVNDNPIFDLDEPTAN